MRNLQTNLNNPPFLDHSLHFPLPPPPPFSSKKLQTPLFLSIFKNLNPLPLFMRGVGFELCSTSSQDLQLIFNIPSAYVHDGFSFCLIIFFWYHYGVFRPLLQKYGFIGFQNDLLPLRSLLL